MKKNFRRSLAEALFWFLGNFIYGLIPLAVVLIYSFNKFIQFLDDGYLVFLSSALVGSIGIDTFLIWRRITAFVCAFINAFGYAVIVYTSVIYVAQLDNQSGFNSIPIVQVGITVSCVIFCIFTKTITTYEQFNN